MLKIKGYKQSKRCATYIKKMISRGFWQVNEPISSTNSIAAKLEMSFITVRNVLKQFERAGMLQSWGSLGYYLVSNVSPTPKKNSVNIRYLRMLETSLKAFDIVRNNGLQKRNWLIHFDPVSRKVVGLNEVSGLTIKSNLNEIFEIKDNLLSLSNVLAIKDFSKFKIAKKKFDRQRELLPMARLVINHRKELGINE